MKNKKNIKILIIVILACIFIAVFLEIVARPLSLSGGQIVPKALSEKNLKVSLVILDKKYETEIKEGSTVLDLMIKVKEENSSSNSFSFKYEESPQLGAFIKEINGKSSGEDGYWIYSINGVEALVGVSNYKISQGDIISWNYQK